MGKFGAYEKIEKYLFKDNDEIRGKKKEKNEVVLSPVEMKMLQRARAGYAFWLERPELPEAKVKEFLMSTFEITSTTAHYDIFAIKKLLGNIYNAQKEWSRYMVIEMCKKAYAMAELKQDAKAMTMAADKIGKYTKCDQNENEQIPWDKIETPNFEPVPDITVLADDEKNLSAVNEEKRLKLRAKYKGVESIQSVEVIE